MQMNPTSESRFTIAAGCWYGWHVFPGYGDLPHASGIFVRAVAPSGGRRLVLSYRDAGYAQGVQDREETVRVLSRGARHLAVRREGDEERVGIVVPMNEAWLRQFVASFAQRMRDGEAAAAFLDREFGERSGVEGGAG